MNTTKFLMNALREEGISHLFFVPGGLIDPFLSDFSSTDGLTPIVACHEGGAACMADGYARASGRFGVCFAIGGPGITNMATGVSAASADGSPLLVVSGEVPTCTEGQGTFQDSSPAALDDKDIFKSITRSSLIVENKHLVRRHLRTSLMKMLSGGRGPVHLSIPTDIQKIDIEAKWSHLDSSVYHPRIVDETGIKRLLNIFNKGQARIAILAGAGVEHSEAGEELLKFAETFDIPVATTLRAKGVFPENHRLSLGVFGYAGHRPAIESILSNEMDMLIVLGSGLTQRDTMNWDLRMIEGKTLVHVDIDPIVIGRTWNSDVPLVGDCGAVLQLLLDSDEICGELESSKNERRGWIEKIMNAGPRFYDFENTESNATPLHPARVVTELRKSTPSETILLVDSGAHRAFCGHYWEANEPRTYISATNLGPMGWAIPASIGVKAARPDSPVAVVTGDGCMLMHGMEIQASARYNLPVIYVVINNSALGNVWLRAHKLGKGPSELTELVQHDWAGFARSMGLLAETVTKPEELAPAFTKAIESGKGYLLDIRCDKVFTTPVNPYSQAKKEWVDDD